MDLPGDLRLFDVIILTCNEVDDVRVDLRAIIKGMREIVRCPSCNAEYSTSDIKLIGWVEENCFLRLLCGCCSLSAVAMVNAKDQVRCQTGHKFLGEVKGVAEVEGGAITALEIAEFHRRITHSKSLISQ
jgi:hypothetical protein